MEETRGDVFRINITPPSTTYPRILLFLHSRGIRRAGEQVAHLGARMKKSRKEVALAIGEGIINNSKVLSDWFDKMR